MIAVLISMILSFWMGPAGNVVPENPARSAEQIIKQLDSFKLEVKRNCPQSFDEFVAVRAELKKDTHRTSYLVN
jgi:hypothetical protein